jgi:hypothetical protein
MEHIVRASPIGKDPNESLEVNAISLFSTDQLPASNSKFQTVPRLEPQGIPDVLGNRHLALPGNRTAHSPRVKMMNIKVKIHQASRSNSDALARRRSNSIPELWTRNDASRPLVECAPTLRAVHQSFI